MTDNSEKRKTLSLKIDANSKHSVRRSNNGNNNFDIEIKKRRRKGLSIDINKSDKSYSTNKQNSGISSKLTDTEFKVRVKVLQEALNKEQQEKSDNVNDNKHDSNIQHNTNRNEINDSNVQNTTNNNIIDGNRNVSENIDSNKFVKDTINNNKREQDNNTYEEKYNKKQDITKQSTIENNKNEDILEIQPVVFRATDFYKPTKVSSDKSKFKEKLVGDKKFNKSNNNNGENKLSYDKTSKFTKKPKSSFNKSQDKFNKEQKPKKWDDKNNEKDKNKYNNKPSFNKFGQEDSKKNTIKIQPDIDPNNIPLNKSNTKTTTKSKSKFNNNDSDNKRKNNTGSKYSDRYSNTSRKITRAALDRAMNDESEERVRSLASTKRAILKSKNADKNNKQEQNKVVREVLIPDNITVGELANRMAVKASEVVKYLMSVGTIATINQLIDGETAEIVCTSFGHIAKRVSESNIDLELDLRDIDKNAKLVQRAPIVAVMGHVDHGKTTLLDTLRKSSVAQKEAGGITQHVASYQVETKGGKKITFIDTPGHAAFTSIRARGAKLTDIIVLVVAADDGIKEQTIEIIKQAQSQNVPLVVAINKIDKPNININKVKNDLMIYDIVLEEFGGETLSCEISAKNNINLDKLLDTILLQAEICDLKANPNRNANGTILEARIDKGRGIVASTIVQGGTLKNGDIFVAGSTFGKVRAMYNNAGQKLNNITPSTPIELIGFDSAPKPGDTIVVVETEQKAKEIAEKRKANKNNSKSSSISIKSINQVMAQESIKILNVFAKADVYGSLEAIVASLEAIKHPEIMVKVIGKDIGIISESDIDFSIPSSAVVIGFNVNSTNAAKESAKINNIKILNHNVIYHLIEEIKCIMSSMLDPIVEEQYIGTADVKKLFVISRLGTIAGCYVSDGIIKRNDSKIKVIRNGKCVFEGKIKSMKHEKDEIKESKQNHECGILADGYNDFQEGDKIECYEIKQKMRTID